MSLPRGEGRIEWIDAAKAIGVFLVFWGHILYGGSNLGGVINRAIYSFHMPMFFILSGYVMKSDSLSFIDYCKNKIKRILLPALILYIITLPLYFYFLDYSTESFKTIFMTIFYVKGSCAYNSPIWFFFCMFQALIILKLIKITEVNNKFLIAILIGCLLVSYIGYESQWNYLNLFGFNKCILGVFFMAIGILLKRISFEKRMVFCGAISFPVWIFTGVLLNDKVSMYGMHLGNFGLFVISSLAGSFAFFSFAKILKNSSMILLYSKWTIFIVCSHYVLVTLFQWISARLSIGGTFVFDFVSALFVLMSLFVYKPICVFIEKRIPILMGKALCKR